MQFRTVANDDYTTVQEGYRYHRNSARELNKGAIAVRLVCVGSAWEQRITLVVHRWHVHKTSTSMEINLCPSVADIMEAICSSAWTVTDIWGAHAKYTGVIKGAGSIGREKASESW